MSQTAEERFYRRHYDQIYETFDDGIAFEQASRILGHRYFCLHEAIQSPRLLSAIECGVGSLNTCAFLQRFFGKYIAVDIAAPQISGEARCAIDGIDIVTHNLNEPWPFQSSQFDVVLAMMVFEHLFDPFFAFAETSRVLKAGGTALINLPIVTSVKNRVRLLCGELPMTSSLDWWSREEWDGGHLHLFNISSVKRLCQRYGLHVAAMYPCGRLPRLKRLWPAGLCGELSFVISKPLAPTHEMCPHG